MISPLTSASLLALPLDNLPLTPALTHSSTSSSPIMDCSRHTDAKKGDVINCRRPTSAPALDKSLFCFNDNLKNLQEKAVRHVNVPLMNTAALASCSNATSESVNGEDATSSLNISHIPNDNCVVPIITEQSTLNGSVDCSATVIKPSMVNYQLKGEAKRNRGNCGQESTKSLQISNSGIMVETLSKFLLAVTTVQKSDNDRFVDWNKQKLRAPPEPSPPADTDHDQDVSPVSSRAARKLKIYTMDEKLDIVDFAVVIGNRAAGREYGVAESSIREWRKNEKKYRQNVATNADKTRIEYACSWVMKEIDEKLLLFIDERKDQGVDWYDIRERGQEIWLNIINSGRLANTNYTSSAISFTMGWVARFMNRNAGSVTNIPKPIVATNTALNNGASVSLNFSGTKNSESALLRSAGGHASTSLKRLRSQSRSEIGEPDITAPKEVKNSKYAPTIDMNVLKPCDFTTGTAQRLLNSSCSDHSQAMGASSRRKSHQPRRLMPDDSLIAIAANNSGSRNGNLARGLSKLTNKSSEQEYSSICNSDISSSNNDMLSAIVKILTNKEASSNQKWPGVDSKFATLTAAETKQLINSPQEQQQQYQQQVFRQMALLMASMPEIKGSQATVNINDNTNNNNGPSAFFPLALNTNAMAALHFIQNMPRLASKDDMKLTK